MGKQKSDLVFVDGARPTGVPSPTSGSHGSNKTYTDSLTNKQFVMGFPLNLTDTRSATVGAWTYFPQEILIPSGFGQIVAYVEAKLQATNAVAVWEFAIAEILSTDAGPTTQIAASITAVTTGGLIQKKSTGLFAITPGRSYVLAAHKISGTGNFSFFSASMIIS